MQIGLWAQPKHLSEDSTQLRLEFPSLECADSK
jgi:hypothetical protein